MDDLISRQDAISAICNACGKIDCDKMDKCEKLQLPPANCSEFPNNSDTISRRQAIAEFSCCELTPDGGIDANYAIDFLKQLPSAQPERKKGSWNVIQGDIVVCSKCGMLAPKSMTGCLLNRHLEPNRTNFCPNCGADMRGEQDG